MPKASLARARGERILRGDGGQLFKRQLPTLGVLCFLGSWSCRHPNHGECSQSIPGSGCYGCQEQSREPLAGGGTNERLVTLKCCAFCPVPQVQGASEASAQRCPPFPPQHGTLATCRRVGTGVGDWQAGEAATCATVTSMAAPGTLPIEELVQGAVTIFSKHTTKDSTDGLSEEGESEERPFNELEWCQVSPAQFLCIFCSVTCPPTPWAYSSIELCSPVLLIGLHSLQNRKLAFYQLQAISPSVTSLCVRHLFLP